MAWVEFFIGISIGIWFGSFLTSSKKDDSLSNCLERIVTGIFTLRCGEAWHICVEKEDDGDDDDDGEEWKKSPPRGSRFEVN